jgi:hypothetical protein
MQHEVAAVHGLAQRLLDPEPVGGCDQQLWVVKAQAIAAEFLGAEQRGVRGPQQGRGIAAVLGEHCGAAAHADRDLALVDAQRALEAVDQIPGPRLDLIGGAAQREDERELVPAEPGDQAALARDLAQAVADLHQNGIAELVPEAVVDGLEVVEVQEHDRHALGARSGLADH